MLWWLAQDQRVVSVATLEGASLRYSPWLLVVPVLAVWLSGISPDRSDRARLLTMVVLATSGLAIVVAWLASMTAAYYMTKTVLAGVGILFPLALARSTPRADTRRRWAWWLAGFLVLANAYLPLLFASAPKLPVLKIAQGWFLPTVAEADFALRINAIDPTALAWGAFAAEPSRRVNIWLSYGYSSVGSRNLSDPGYAWAYGADMWGLSSVCSIMAAVPEMDAFVGAPAQRDLIAAGCGVDRERLHLDSSVARGR
jgi:hypothetical protein